MNGVNLIPESRRRARQRRRRIGGWTVACSAYAILLIGACVASRVTLRPDTGRLDAERADTEAQMAEVTRQMTGGRAQLAEGKARLQTVELVSKQPDWSILLTALGEAIGDEAVLNTISLEPMQRTTAGGGTGAGKAGGKGAAEPAAQPAQWKLDLQGHGLTQPSVSRLILRLQGTGLFQDITLQRTRREPFFSGQAVAFQLQCILGEARSPR